MTNDEVRRNRLEQLAARVTGGLKAIAEQVGTHPQYLDHIVKRRLLPARADGRRLPAGVGDDLARRIEAAFGLTPGWMDWPLASVDYEQYSRLTEAQRQQVEGAVRLVLATIDSGVTTPDHAVLEARRAKVAPANVTTAKRRKA